MQIIFPRWPLILVATSIFLAAIATAILYMINFKDLMALVMYPLILIVLSILGRYFVGGFLQYVVIYAVAIVAALFLFELYSIASFHGRKWVYTGTYAHSYFQYDPNLGYTTRGPARVSSKLYDRSSGKILYDVTYSISELGFRETIGNKGAKSIIFFPDSFMFGDGLNDADTLPQAFSDLADRRYHVLNFGFHGYGPQQSLRMLELGLFDRAIGDKPLLFIFQTAVWHVERAACIPEYTYLGPRYELTSEGTIQYRGACRSWITYQLFRLTKLSYGLTKIWDALYERPLHDRDFLLYIGMLKQLDKLIREKYHSRLLIAFLRFDGDGFFQASSYSNEKLIDSLMQSNIPVIDATLKPKGEFLRSYGEGEDDGLSIKGEGHPNAFAQKQRAKLLYDWFRHHVLKTD